MKRIILGIITLLTISCNEKPQMEFSFNGTTNGIENGTMIYLDNDNQIIDSTRIENNSFVFNSKLSKSPLRLVLRTKDYSHYRFLWVENKPMTFDATKTDFRNAKVTGSEIEDLNFNHRQKVDSLPRNKRQELEIEFIKANPKSIISASLLSLYSKTWGKEKTKELFDQFSIDNKDSEYGKSISKYIELNKNPKVGEKYVDFEMENINGEMKKISDFNDKIVLLEFWASHCGPCRQENPNLVKTYKKYKPKGFEIYAVSQDTKKTDWLKAIEKDELTWLQVNDLQGRNNLASIIYGINGIPDNFLIDKNGIIVGRNLRGEKLNEKLAELLN